MNKVCTRCKEDFSIDNDDLLFYQKMKVPPPNVCPDCRFMMRCMWRNEISLYSGRTCELCKSPVISIYNPKSKYTTYCYTCFYSEKWNPRDFLIEYDYSRPFFDQVSELFEKVPKNCLGISTGDGQNTNSEYVNMASGCKNCYLVFNTSPAEELLYSRGVKNGNYSSDIYFGVDFEKCYECINIQKSSGVYFGHNCTGCVDSFFILNSSNLVNCFGCVNLRNKSNCWFNEQLTQEEYKKRLSEVMGSYTKIQEMKQKFYDFCLQFPHRENNNLKTIDSDGEYLTECKNIKHSFEVTKSEDGKYLFSSKVIKDSIGTIGYGTNSEKLLECVATGYSSNIIGSYWAENCQNVLYSFDLRNCSNCIGCDSLKNAEYCILNKQYSKEEYEKIKDHIAEELTSLGIHGLMMPPEIAPFGYNETIGNDNIPLSKNEVLKKGLKWQDDIQKTIGNQTIQFKDIPDHIDNVQDTIIGEIFECISCQRNYKITEQELFFYKRMNLPLPRKCFFCRHRDRIEKRGPYKFWDRGCTLCKKNILTNYEPNRKEIVYCEECYRREVL